MCVCVCVCVCIYIGAPWSTQDNSSMSCKELVIRVTMPDTKFSTV